MSKPITDNPHSFYEQQPAQDEKLHEFLRWVERNRGDLEEQWQKTRSTRFWLWCLGVYTGYTEPDGWKPRPPL